MKTNKLNTKAPKVNREIELEFNDPENSTEAVEMFGESAWFELAFGALNVARQGRIRALLEKGTSAEEITNIMKAWKPGVRVSTTVSDPLAAAKNLFAAMSPDEQAAYLEQLRASLGG